MVDYADLIGRPFVTGGRGPENFDCYGLVMYLLRENHDQAIPDFRSSADQALISANMALGVQEWQEVSPQPGAVVMLRIGRYISHVGYQIDPMRMIHTWEKSGGVLIERLDTWKKRTVGFYKYVGNSNKA